MDDLELKRLRAALDFIPADSYDTWCSVGMALKDTGADLLWLWEEWSRKSPKNKPGDCAGKWGSFGNNPDKERVTLGTVFQLAKDGGWSPPEVESRALELGEVLDWIPEPEHAPERRQTGGVPPLPPPPDPAAWNRAAEIDRYINAVFRSGDTVSYVMEFYQMESGRYGPMRGNWELADSILERLRADPTHPENAIGQEDPNNGAQIRLNPVRAKGPENGKGFSDRDVTAWRFTLIESDSIPIEKQWEWLNKLKLPIAAVVHSGSKSLHAVVHVDAITEHDFRTRRRYIEEICTKAGFPVDTNDKNPSRLSRLPGVMRGDKPQYLVSAEMGFRTFFEWHSWIEEQTIDDSLPEIVKLADIEKNQPQLAPVLIEDILRKGHKMLLAGPSKAGKSHLLAELAISIANGGTWLGHQCTRSQVLYINLEVDQNSWYDTMLKISRAMGYTTVPDTMDVWCLRGCAEPMDRLLPKIVKRLRPMGEYGAIIIDPIYKVITGDENSATDMAEFVNYFDKLCNTLGCSVIYCHHHSKGIQTGKKAIDRSSGSGVFARDPDAIIDMTEIPDDQLEPAKNKLLNISRCRVCEGMLADAGAIDAIPDNGFQLADAAMNACNAILDPQDMAELSGRLRENEKNIRHMSAWRIDGALREFPPPDPMDIWYSYPIHTMDPTGQLQYAKTKLETIAEKFKRSKSKRRSQLEAAFEKLQKDGEAIAKEVNEELDLSADMKTLKGWVADSGTFEWIPGGKRQPAKIRKLYNSQNPPQNS